MSTLNLPEPDLMCTSLLETFLALGIDSSDSGDLFCLSQAHFYFSSFLQSMAARGSSPPPSRFRGTTAGAEVVAGQVVWVQVWVQVK